MAQAGLTRRQENMRRCGAKVCGDGDCQDAVGKLIARVLRDYQAWASLGFFWKLNLPDFSAMRKSRSHGS
jgi:hypothetical protein